ncbi:formin-binding protein 4 [Dendroctonus ponderosae]|uniref:formin-binding protein 4 n=1 Tax=Dendroctonus ponderosae TaxID=77166 RepID=UPI002034AE9F|nr:formin-binding protein 4 [Dendroctonus ponderosae]
MDATVNDFFKEIKELVTKSEPKVQEEVWHECFDELTGYSYFWNTQTDEVTWVPPKSYKRAENNPKKNTTKAVVEKDKKKVELFVPPTTGNVPQCSMPEAKVYSIQDTMKESEPVKKQPIGRKHTAKKPVLKRPFRKSEDSDDEKIELITEYAANSDSDNDDKNSQPPLDQNKSTESPLTLSLLGKDSILLDQNPKSSTSVVPKQSDSQTDEEDDDDDLDILAKIQQRAQELKKMGGEVPSSVKQIIKKTEIIETPKKPSVSGFSLVAGYNSDSESEPELQEAPPIRPIFPVACLPISPIVETSHSTLFPITKPIDVKDFISYEPPANEVAKEAKTNKVESSDFDSKAFQRKRRIGISLVNNVKRPKEDVIPGTDFVGLGFKSEIVDNGYIKTTNEDAPVAYPGFQKGGVMFVKSDVLNSTVSQEKGPTKETDHCLLNKKQAEDDYTILREKLLFLGEGRDVVLPVQVMIIQAETLFQAMKEGGLNISYLRKWLSETCSDLVNLEKEAAPEGWLLQWDRSHKRYFYQNQTTGVNQWRYPEPDVTRCDDAMDISTTPPPMDVKDEPAVFGPSLPSDPPLPPTPPKIRSPTPPPPPKITMATTTIDVPILPAQSQASEVIILHPILPGFDIGQPLPPGVDLITSVSNKNLEEVSQKPTDTLITALDSFYSEIAEVSENTNSLSPVSAQIPETPIETSIDVANPQHNSEPIRKKKKKVKLAQGLTMKKKGVSQLVEKWKNVQKSYGD